MMKPFRKSLAVVVGIDAYSHGIPPLRTAGNDARRLAQVLKDDHSYSTWLVDAGATLARLRRLLTEDIPRQLRRKDRLLFYFAGHGIALDGEDGPAGYLIPEDARRDDRESFLPMRELHDALSALPCQHLLVILDCCFAGTFRWSTTRRLTAVPEVIHKERYDRYVRDPAWQVITSAAYDQEAFDVFTGRQTGPVPSGDHSPFAEALFRGLSGEADVIPRGGNGRPGGDGVITATELYICLRECVEQALGPGACQTPGLWPLPKHDKGEYILLVPGAQVDLPSAPELNDKNNPYRGLQSFDEEHGPLFFGRRSLVAALHEHVRSHPLSVVLGASGTGKSSAVKAGLLPALRRAEGEGWRIAPVLRPGRSPLAALGAIRLPGTTPGPNEPLGHSPSIDLARRVTAWAEADPEGRLLLIVDQFEELITLCQNAGEQAAFVDELKRALAACPARFRVVLTLRSDFEPQFADGGLKETWMASRLVVPPLSRDELREIIEGPAAVRTLYFDPPELADRLVDDVVQTPGALPLLSFTLRELYVMYVRRQGNDRSLRLEDYTTLGGVGGSLRNRATEEFDRLPDDAHRATMKRVMLRMVSLEGGELARRRVPRTELQYAEPAENTRVAEVLERLTTVRLVVRGSEVDDQEYVEPAHDELVRGWEKLLLWVREEHEQVTLRRLLTPAVNDWKGGKGGLWWANPRLPVLSRMGRRPSNWLNRDEEDFVRRSRNRRRWASGVVLGGVLALLVLAGIAWNRQYQFELQTLKADGEEKERKRQEAEAKAQGEQARLARNMNTNRTIHQHFEDGDLEQGFSYLVRALREDSRNGLAADRLASFLTHRRQPTLVRESAIPEGDLAGFDLAPDGAVAFWRKAGNADLLTPSGRTLPLETGGESVTFLRFTPDGSQVVGGTATQIRIWSAANARLARPPVPAPKGAIPDIRLDSTLLAVRIDGKEVRFVPLRNDIAAPESIRLDDAPSEIRFAGRDRILVLRSGRATLYDITSGKPVGGLWPGKDDEADGTCSGIETAPDGTCAIAVVRDVDGLITSSELLLYSPKGIPDSRHGVRFESTNISQLSLSADGTVLAATAFGVGVHVLVRGTSGGEPSLRTFIPVPELISARITPDGKQVIAWDRMGNIRIFLAKTGHQLALPFRQSGQPPLDRRTSGDWVASADDHQIRIWTIAGVGPVPLAGTRTAPRSATPTRWVGAGSASRGLRRGEISGDWLLVARETRQPIASFSHPLSLRDQVQMEERSVGDEILPVTGADLSGDGRRVVTIAGSEPPSVWSVDPPKKLFSLGETRDRLFASSVRVAKASDRVLIEYQRAGTFDPRAPRAGRGEYRAFSLETGQPLGELAILERGEMILDLSPDGQRLLIGKGRFVYVRDFFDPTQRTERLATGEEVLGGQFSPDGLRFVVASRDGTARIVDTATALPASEVLIFDPARHPHSDPSGNLARSYHLLQNPPRFSESGRQIVVSLLETNGVKEVVADSGYELTEKEVERLIHWAEAVHGNRSRTGEDSNGRFEKDLLPGRDFTRLMKWLLADPTQRSPTPLTD